MPCMNFVKCSFPAGSARSSFKLKAHRFILRTLIINKITHECLSQSHTSTLSNNQGLLNSGGVKNGSYSAYCSNFILRRSSFSRIAVMSFFIDSMVGLPMLVFTGSCIGTKLLMSPFAKYQAVNKFKYYQCHLLPLVYAHPKMHVLDYLIFFFPCDLFFCLLYFGPLLVKIQIPIFEIKLFEVLLSFQLHNRPILNQLRSDLEKQLIPSKLYKTDASTKPLTK
ncbi:hypothetical protein AGLY_008083 [Aphis glycines]|uniref:Uncharacterized protein n=1 Tax=Aphis glycines TaxID=307491 RepID=A0A6G0TL98_APHGL|nr:hypothetical protein AGLY_008083 [Aphis glycines]